MFALMTVPPTIQQMEIFDSGSRAPRRAGWVWGILALTLLASCQEARGPVSIKSDDPDLKILAITHDATHHDSKDIPQMVEDLQSDDAAIRFYSIGALHRLTGDDLGYHYFETEEQRAPALLRWQQWLKQRTATASKGS